MAIPTNIKTLLSGEVVEWARIEFKETWDAAASLKTVCAFANDLDNWGGGYIVIGVKEEDGRPAYPLNGVSPEKIDAYQKSIFAKCKLIRPAYTPIIGVETYQDRQFIVIWCPGGDCRPYSSPEVRIEHDRIEIVSFPGPDRSVTKEGLKQYRVSNRRYRKRRIGDFLKELHLTESRNTGFKKILDALEENGSPKPEFETDDDHSYFISRLFIHESFLNEEPKRNQNEDERSNVILNLLKKNPTMTQTMLMDKLQLSRKQVQRVIKELQEQGLLKREGSNRNGKWLVKK